MNPFTERGRITDPRRFAGRWRELSLIFERLESRRPVLVVGPPAVGKSSLLMHLAQAAAAAMDEPDLMGLYADLAVLPDAASYYRLVVEALGSRGDSSAALEVALLEAEGPVLLCLDGAETAVAAGWGELLLERLARMARAASAGWPLLLVAAVEGPPPRLSEPFAVLRLGAFAPAEVRLFADAYLDGSGVQFSPPELRALADLSTGHPAYLQRAAYHLFQARLDPDYNWRDAYLAEARERPVPGAPLPAAAFEGGARARASSAYGDLEGTPAAGHAAPQIQAPADLLAVLAVLVAALVAFQRSGSWLVAAGVLVLAAALALGVSRALGPRRGSD